MFGLSEEIIFMKMLHKHEGDPPNSVQTSNKLTAERLSSAAEVSHGDYVDLAPLLSACSLVRFTND